MNMQSKGCAARVTGSFLQPGLCQSWDTKDTYYAHCQMLRRAGIHQLILQWNCETQGDALRFIACPVEELSGMKQAEEYFCDEHTLDYLLEAAKANDCVVFMGLNLSNDWWDEKNQRDEQWYRWSVGIGSAVAREIYNRYKKEYPETLYGWYFANELYSQRDGLEKHWSRMLSLQLEQLSAIDPGMPMLISPFISSARDITPQENEQMWTYLVENTSFRSGDILCPQDSYGGSGYELYFIEQHLQGIARAAAKRPECRFWINTENFAAEYQPAPVERFIRQMQMEAPYAENLITFSYDHYYNPATEQGAPCDEQYRAYLSTIDSHADETGNIV